MKFIFSVLLSFMCMGLIAQPWYPQYNNVQFKGKVAMDKMARLPIDTIVGADTGSIAYKNGLFYGFNGAKWGIVTGSNWYNVKQNGGDNTGATDISSLVNAAQDAGNLDIYLPKGRYKLSASLQLKNGVTITGDGRGLTTLVLSGNIKGIVAGHVKGGYGAQITNLSIEGSKSGGATSAQTGIYLDSVSKVLIHNVKITNVGGPGIEIRRNGYCCGTYTQTATRGNTISDCYIDSSGIGIYLKEGTASPSDDAEYNKVIGCTLHGNVVGARIGGGNNTISSTTITYNSSMGLYLTGGGNNGHGIVDGCTINHNYRSLYIDGNTKGVSMTGNNIHSEDSIVVRGSSYVHIVGGWFYSPVVYFDNSTNCVITGTSTLVGNEPTITVGTGEAPTYIKAGKSDNTLSWIDAKNSKEFAIGHTNGVVTFTGLISQNTAADSMMVINASTGSVGYRSIPTGGGGSNYWTLGSGNIYNNTGTYVGIGTSSPSNLLTIGNGNIEIKGAGPGGLPGYLTFGQTYGGDALKLYDGGPGDCWGWGLQAGNMQFHIPTNGTQIYSWNGGGDLQTPGTNELMRLNAAGRLGIGTTSPTALLDVNSNVLRLRTTKTPSSSTDTGNQGDICWDANYLYIGVGTNSWKRVSISASGW